jgi:predicted transcriptional regulator
MQDKKTLIENLEMLPSKITDKRKKLLELSNELNELKAVVKSDESAMFNLVYNEKEEVEDKDGKRVMKNVFSNDKARAAETEKRLLANQPYQEKQEKIKKLGKEIADEEISLEFLKLVFRSAESMSRIGVD